MKKNNLYIINLKKRRDKHILLKYFSAIVLLLFFIFYTACSKYEEKKYLVNFNTNGADTIKSVSLLPGDKVPMPINPVKSGCVFEGWFIDSNFSSAFNFDTSITSNTTIYAKWKIPIETLFVEGGTFMMGCTSEQGSDCDDWEKPSHFVTVSNFNICKYEITQGYWVAVMGNNITNLTSCGNNCPIVNVSWNDVQDFIKKLNQQTGKNYRLPTEAEWEYAARGGKLSKGYKYAGSNDVNEVAWNSNNSSKIQVVGQKLPNELGIYDMSGNVLEWVNDWYDGYSNESKTNPTGSSTGPFRVLRGGSWYRTQKDTRVSYRNFNHPTRRDFYYGFRLVFPE